MTWPERLRSYWVFLWTERLGLKRPLPPPAVTDAVDHDAQLAQLAEQAAEHWREVEAKIHMYRQEARISTLRAQKILSQKDE